MALTVETLETEAFPVNVCVLSCDSAYCPNVFRRETSLFKDAYRDAKALGWKTQYYRGELMTFCPECAR